METSYVPLKYSNAQEYEMIERMPPEDSRHTLEEETLRIMKERERLRRQFAEGIASSIGAAGPVKSMSRDKANSGVASKLKKAGVTLIALPDPVTGAVGVPVLAAGFAIEKIGNRELTLPEVTAELVRTFRELQRLRSQTLR